jgi:hypothetical protein
VGSGKGRAVQPVAFGHQMRTEIRLTPIFAIEILKRKLVRMMVACAIS